MLQTSLLDLSELCQSEPLDYQLALELIARVPDSFIGGSYIIDPDNANDIDIVVPQRSHSYLSTDNCLKYGLHSYSPTGEEYEQDVVLEYIIQLYRGNGGINVIVVADHYYVAYLAGKLEYERNPDKYRGNKELRSGIHKQMKQTISDMLTGEYFNARVRNYFTAS